MAHIGSYMFLCIYIYILRSVHIINDAVHADHSLHLIRMLNRQISKREREMQFRKLFIVLIIIGTRIHQT